MNKKDILHFVTQHFTNHRKALIPKIQSFEWDKSIPGSIYQEISTQINKPMTVWGDLSPDQKEQLSTNISDSDELGDISDTYNILLNPEISTVDSWDFEEAINTDQELHFCNIYINWFLPVYFIETTYDKGLESGKLWQYGPLNVLSELEKTVVEKVKKILHSHGYKPLPHDFLATSHEGLQTDCSAENKASLHECLFSDAHYPSDQHIRKSNQQIKDPFDENITYAIRFFLNDDDEITSSERTIYNGKYHKSVTIRTDENQGISNVTCYGNIKGTQEREINIPFELGNKV